MLEPDLRPAESERAPVTQLGGGRRKAALGFIFATQLMDVTSLGIMIPVLPNLVVDMVAKDHIGLTREGVFAIAIVWTGLFQTCWGLAQFFCSPIQGMLSDRYGRRPVLLISIFGLSIDYLFMALAPTVGWLFVGRMINGVTAASFSTAGAYITDITKPENRAKAFGFMGAAFGGGFIIGPAIGSALGHFGLRAPFYFAFAIGIVNWLYGLLILPESLPKEKREPRFVWSKANPVGAFKLLNRHPDLLGMGVLLFLFQISQFVYPALFIQLVNFRYGWTEKYSGFLLMGVGVFNILVQVFLTGPAVRRFGERGIVLIGLSVGFLGMMIYALAENGFIFLLGAPLAALFGFVNSGIQGLMTRRVAPSEQGQLQGANSSFQGITATIAPQIFSNVFAWSILRGGAVGWHGLGGLILWGAPILLAAGFTVAALLLALRVAKPVAPQH